MNPSEPSNQPQNAGSTQAGQYQSATPPPTGPPPPQLSPNQPSYQPAPANPAIDYAQSAVDAAQLAEAQARLQPAPQLPGSYEMPVGNPYQAQQPPGVATKPVMPSNPNSTQNSLHISEIRDGIVIMNDGGFRAVVMCKSVNFDLMSPQEREAVEYSYQGFLNSLYFPIQIFVRSQKVDLRPYITKLDKIRTEHDNMLLALLMEDYIGFMDELAQQTNIMDKKFYLVVPYFPTLDAQRAVQASKNFMTNVLGNKEQSIVINEADLEKAKTELRNRVQSVLGGLMQCGVQALPLDTQELIELYYDAYNPDTATHQKLKNFNDLTAPVITKGEGLANQPQLNRELQ